MKSEMMMNPLTQILSHRQTLIVSEIPDEYYDYPYGELGDDEDDEYSDSDSSPDSDGGEYLGNKTPPNTVSLGVPNYVIA